MPTSTLYNADKIFRFFKGMAIFTNVNPSDVMNFVEAGLSKTFSKGQTLYLEGDVATHFYVILSGWVKIYRVTEDGEEVSLTMLSSGKIAGEYALFENDHYGSSAQIVEETTVVAIPLHILKTQLKTDTAMAHNLMVSMVKRQRLHETLLEHFLVYSAPQRLGCFLLGLCPKTKQKDGAVIMLPYDKRLIASTLNMKGPTFSRALNTLRDETGIRISGTKVTISSISRLLNFVNGCYALEAFNS